MSDWTWEYVPDAANVVGGLTRAQIDQVGSLASRIADAVAVRRIGTPFDVTEAVILQERDTADSHGTSEARYQRPYAVPERLDLLRGPSSGTVHLPSHLDWSGNAVYDLDAPGRVVDLYRAVLIEAASPQDLYAYLDEGVLRRLWALLWLPAQLRSAWEQRFPALAEISRITAAA